MLIKMQHHWPQNLFDFDSDHFDLYSQDQR